MDVSQARVAFGRRCSLADGRSRHGLRWACAVLSDVEIGPSEVLIYGFGLDRTLVLGVRGGRLGARTINEFPA